MRLPLSRPAACGLPVALPAPRPLEHAVGISSTHGRGDDRDERRRGGRRGEPFHGRGEGRYPRREPKEESSFNGNTRRFDAAVSVTEDEAIDDDSA